LALQIFAAFAAVLAVAVLAPKDSQARLQPYYVLRTATGADTIVPRILFVLDTSGSMSWRAQAANANCAWGNCENVATQDTTNESRLAAARRAIQTVVTTLGDDAKFAMMTFEQNDPHNNTVPAKCSYVGPVGADSNCCRNHSTAGCDDATCAATICGYDSFCCTTEWDDICQDEAANDCAALCDYEDTRFTWATWFNNSGWGEITGVTPGESGTWHLCQGSRTRPYPYLRWDNLGAGSVVAANNQAGTPASPLIDVNQLTSFANARRNVQFFPSFQGVHWQPNDTTDPGRVMAYASIGDYGDTSAQIDSNVWEQDFYYWPYVDGFPGYSQMDMWPNYGGENTGGIASQDNNVNTGKLYAPFYLDLSGTPVNPNYWGPVDAQAAMDTVLAHSGTMVQGGVDSGGGTPWSSTIGPIPAAPSQSNSIFTHTTVGSYLKFVTNIETPDVCAPTAAILITDGEPSNNEGGSGLYTRIADLRKDLNVQVYVVGFFLGGSAALNDMACAGAGACDGTCSTPCDDASADNWDTCRDPADPANNCAYVANSAAELATILAGIVNQLGDFDVPSGPGSTVNEFGIGDTGNNDGVSLQTQLAARTEYPEWRGHLARQACTDEVSPGVPADYCVPPSPEFEPEDIEETFGPCSQSRIWDAGTCLQMTNWTDRRLYSHDAANNVYAINTASGDATGTFVSELQAQSLIPGVNPQDEADEIAAFLLGRDAPGGWKLPGLANSAPIIARRIPEYNEEVVPSVAVRDPHCGGRLLSFNDQLPTSLEEFAQDSWDPALRIPNPSPHYEYQEAVLMGDDMGMLHAFQLDSGNELFGFVPRVALPIVAEEAANGADSYGQPDNIEDHIYGIASSVNHTWIYDDSSANATEHRWRHLAIVGMGVGGTSVMALDISHMSPVASTGNGYPIEVMWTTEQLGDNAVSPGDTALYAQYNGETWARPAISYHVPNENADTEPSAFVVFGTGYQPGAGYEPETHNSADARGRVLFRADARTGDVLSHVILPEVTHSTYETAYGTVVDPAVGTHCRSRLWAEAQEAYIADPAGQLFRWDLGRETVDTAQAADSGAQWVTTPGTAGVGIAATAALPYLPACTGATAPCTVSPANPGDPFLYSPSVTSNDRLDDFFSTSLDPVADTDQLLVAMISGSAADDSLDQNTTNFHSSLYLLVDDHTADPNAGFSIPAGAPLADPGTDAAYMRVPVTAIERTRLYTPYSGASQISETRTFNPTTRPIRAPRIFVTGAVEDTTNAQTVIEGVEVYFIEYTVYEPPTAACDSDFYDASTGTWYQDPGSSFRITYRLTSTVSSGFNFQTGATGGPADFGAGFEQGLTLVDVEQLDEGGVCPDGECGAVVGVSGDKPCDLNEEYTGSVATASFSIAVQQSELDGFSPIE
jgi:hypothetical protein